MVATVRHTKIQKIQTAHTFSYQYSSGGKNHQHDSIKVWGFINDFTYKMCKAQVRAKRTKINWKPENTENFK